MVSGGSRIWLAGTVFLLAAQAATAAPNFIAGSRVSGDPTSADIEIRLHCQASYLNHEPQAHGDQLRIFIDPTSICDGVSPLAAQSRGRYRPANADVAGLIDFEYDGESAAGPVLTLNFSEAVSFTIDASRLDFVLNVRVRRDAVPVEPAPIRNPDVLHERVTHTQPQSPDFIVNLASFQRTPTVTDVSKLQLMPNQRVFYSRVVVDGEDWYRLRLGDFSNADDAQNALGNVKDAFSDAWIGQIESDSPTVDLTVAVNDVRAAQLDMTAVPGGDSTVIDRLMEEARLAMAAGERSRSIQIYTKIMQLPQHPRQIEAQEYLALAREKNGQTAHAKAEYQRYLSLYPDSDGADRVNQRLAALLSTDVQPRGSAIGIGKQRTRQASAWRLQTYFSQYYRRDVNQLTDQDEIVSQSALYSDVNFDARRRGERFDFSSRISVGYRNDFLDENAGSGNDTRVSYAYADLADAVTGLRGRIGRQSRNSGGVLGRFDGINLGYQASERILISSVVGKPAYSTSDGIDTARTFYGASVDYGPLWDGLELGVFFIQQEIENVTDRQAFGGEFRYFGSNQSYWGHVDYDAQFNELGSAFLQANWRVASRLSLSAAVDRRHSPFLSAGNAIIGQPVGSFAALAEIFSEDEIRQLGLDRSPLSTSYSMGVSYTLSPKLQINADANQTSVDATPTSGGVFAMPESRYRYFSASVVASSLLREGDVTIIGLRHSASDTSKTISLTVDSRYPFSRSWRVNPRLRIDRRSRIGQPDYEWNYTPGVRIQFRHSQKFRFELEAGKQYTEQKTVVVNSNRESYFVNLGYQMFF